MRRPVALSIVVVSSLALAGSASASQLIDRNAGNVKLKVSRDGKAMLTYRARGRRWDVLAWGALNARHPTTARKQVQFRLDRAGGWGTFGRKLGFGNACRPYDGPQLVHVVQPARRQTARTGLSSAGVGRSRTSASRPGCASSASGRSTSHTGPARWPSSRDRPTGRGAAGYHHIFGRLTYLGRPVHGYKTNQFGARKDKYGRLVYLDTFGSKHGPGWRRENSFVTHKATGVFCYNFRARNPLEGGYAHPPRYRGGLRGPGNGEAYRMIVEGPGVTPDVKWEGRGLPSFDPSNPVHVAHEQTMNDQLDSLNDPLCSHH